MTPAKNGFMSAGDKAKLDQLSTTTPPAHNHDSQYTPLSHAGAAGNAHPAATASQAGFLSAADKQKLDRADALSSPLGWYWYEAVSFNFATQAETDNSWQGSEPHTPAQIRASAKLKQFGRFPAANGQVVGFYGRGNYHAISKNLFTVKVRNIGAGTETLTITKAVADNSLAVYLNGVQLTGSSDHDFVVYSFTINAGAEAVVQLVLADTGDDFELTLLGWYGPGINNNVVFAEAGPNT